MKCNKKNDLLITSKTLNCGNLGYCNSHKFCQKCFRQHNINFANKTSLVCQCPCCYAPFYDDMLSFEEAVLFGEAATFCEYLYDQLTKPMLPESKVIFFDKLLETTVKKLEAAYLLNPTNFKTIYLLFIIGTKGLRFRLDYPKDSEFNSLEYFRIIICDNAFRLLDHPVMLSGNDAAKIEIYSELSRIFFVHYNIPTALKYAKLAYEYCLRSPAQYRLGYFKDVYLDYRTAFAELPPLRFAVGDEVEFLHELETGGEWRKCKIVELYYRERDFEVSVIAPYRLQLLKDTDSDDESDTADQPPIYAWVKADQDRYVRKVGVRSIEDTRYQARLDAKVEELARVYCSKEFMQDIYRTLAQDLEFVEHLLSEWDIELSEHILYLYRVQRMCRLPLIRTGSGYYIPTADEVIAGIKDYFDPIHRDTSTAEKPSNSAEVMLLKQHNMTSLYDGPRARVIMLRRADIDDETTDGFSNDTSVFALLIQSIMSYVSFGAREYQAAATADASTLLLRKSAYTLPLPDSCISPVLNKAVSKASSQRDLRNIVSEPWCDDDIQGLAMAWIPIHQCLEDTATESACECPYVYFLVRYCLGQGAAVPKLVLALYDRMNMQLSRDFIRCANPTCELNKLDESGGKVKFKKCSCCLAVIYCSRECQVAHYPEHKRLCREHTTA